jgi:hypothetical protein
MRMWVFCEQCRLFLSVFLSRIGMLEELSKVSDLTKIRSAVLRLLHADRWRCVGYSGRIFAVFSCERVESPWSNSPAGYLTHYQ